MDADLVRPNPQVRKPESSIHASARHRGEICIGLPRSDLRASDYRAARIGDKSTDAGVIDGRLATKRAGYNVPQRKTSDAMLLKHAFLLSPTPILGPLTDCLGD
jgi:hypothetical protein